MHISFAIHKILKINYSIKSVKGYKDKIDALLLVFSKDFGIKPFIKRANEINAQSSIIIFKNILKSISDKDISLLKINRTKILKKKRLTNLPIPTHF